MNTIKVLQELAALKRNEKKSAPQLRRFQEQKLRAMLTYAYEHSRYYKSAFETAGLTAESVKTAPLSTFPTLNKQILLERFDEVITLPDVTQEELRRFDAEETADRKPYKGKYHVVHSSGSTGTPKGVQITRNCLDCFIQWGITLGRGLDTVGYVYATDSGPAGQRSPNRLHCRH